MKQSGVKTAFDMMFAGRHHVMVVGQYGTTKWFDLMLQLTEED
jgi:hypothetical protein